MKRENFFPGNGEIIPKKMPYNSKTVVVITGASSGLGRDISITMAKNKNHHIVMVARNKVKLEEVKDTIEQNGGSATFYAADISSEEEIKGLANYLKEGFGKVNILINNAGLGIFKPMIELTSEEWKAMQDTMIFGTFICTKYLLPMILCANEPRHVLINSSYWGLKGDTPLCTAYIASKFAQRGISLSLREELRYHNIKVTCLLPGSIQTPFFDHGGGWPHDPNRILSSEDLAELVNDIVNYKGNLVVEEVVIQGVNPD